MPEVVDNRRYFFPWQLAVAGGSMAPCLWFRRPCAWWLRYSRRACFGA